MQKKKMKVKNPLDDEDEESEEERLVSQIAIGDLVVSSKAGIGICNKTINKLLNNNKVKNYLQIYNKRKLITPAYIG